MKVVFKESPSTVHKYRVLFPDRRFVDFGDRRSHDYTTHGNPRLMRAHLLRHGAKMSKEMRLERDPYEIHRAMLQVKESRTEDWDYIYGRDYWERWVLWSYPTVNQAKLYLTMRENILFMPYNDTFPF